MAGAGMFSQLTTKMPPERCIERMTEELREEIGHLAQLRMARKATTRIACKGAPALAHAKPDGELRRFLQIMR